MQRHITSARDLRQSGFMVAYFAFAERKSRMDRVSCLGYGAFGGLDGRRDVLWLDLTPEVYRESRTDTSHVNISACLRNRPHQPVLFIRPSPDQRLAVSICHNFSSYTRNNRDFDERPANLCFRLNDFPSLGRSKPLACPRSAHHS